MRLIPKLSFTEMQAMERGTSFAFGVLHDPLRLEARVKTRLRSGGPSGASQAAFKTGLSKPALIEPPAA